MSYNKILIKIPFIPLCSLSVDNHPHHQNRKSYENSQHYPVNICTISFLPEAANCSCNRPRLSQYGPWGIQKIILVKELLIYTWKKFHKCSKQRPGGACLNFRGCGKWTLVRKGSLISFFRISTQLIVWETVAHNTKIEKLKVQVIRLRTSCLD